MSAPAPRSPLARVVGRWSGSLGGGAPPGSGPLLRIEHGAALLQGQPPALLEEGVDRLMRAVGPLLATPPTALGAATVRAKVRLELRAAGAGFLARVRYYGTTPAGAQREAVGAALGPGACLLSPRCEDGEVSLRAVLQPPARDVAVVHVLAGRRPVALPLACVQRALAEDARLPEPLRILSLARCLDEEPVPAAGRAALLEVRHRGPALALRVELLVGHGSERVLPAGPLLFAVPWLLGVVARQEEAPEMVVDPVALVRVMEECDGG